MWIQVRTIDGSQTRTIEDVSRKATIEELRERVWALFDVRPECQRLFYRGKQVRRARGASSRMLPARGLEGRQLRRGGQGARPARSGAGDPRQLWSQVRLAGLRGEGDRTRGARRVPSGPPVANTA